MSKKDYRVRNWAQYNRSLMQRGDLTFWINAESWYEASKKAGIRGRPKIYGDAAIVTMLVLKQLFHMTLRSCQGFVESLFRQMNLNKQVPHYSQVCRRQAYVVLPKLPSSREKVHIAIDSSGLKVYGDGEWKARLYRSSKRREWRKLHIAIDEKNQLIVSALLTDYHSGDDKKLEEILNQYEGLIAQVSADGAYDSHECHRVIGNRGAVATIPPQPNPRHPPKKAHQIRRPRDRIVWEIQEQGREEWKRESGYHRRSLVETAFYRYKQIFGGKLQSRRLENQRIEALINCHVLNKITLMGMPDSAPI